MACGPAATRRAVVKSSRAKAAIVAADERETGDRQLLNLGHTFAHAFEVESGYGGDLLHGEAVSIGMVMAFDLSVRLGLCPADDAARVRRHPAEIGLTVRPSPRHAPDAPAARLHKHQKAPPGRQNSLLPGGPETGKGCG